MDVRAYHRPRIIRRRRHDRPDRKQGSAGAQYSKGPGKPDRHPHLPADEGPGDHPRQDQGQAGQDGAVGRGPGEPVPHHLEERGPGERRAVPGGAQLCGAAPGAHGRERPHRGSGGQVVPHRLSQGGGLLRLPGPPAGHRPVRRRVSQGGMALHGQLLPGRGVQLQAAGGPRRGHPARRDEPGAV